MTGSGGNSSEKIRAFIAIDIPEDVRDQLVGVISELKRRVEGVKWVRAEGIHLTLKFLGNVDKNMIPSIRREMEKAADGISSFEMEVKGLGAFPTPNRPRVIWAGLEEPTGELAHLAERVENSMKELGFEAEKRKFHPHLTLGRVKKGGKPGKELVGLIERDSEKSRGTFTADELVLFRSVLKPGGAEYTKLETVKLTPQ